LRQCKLSHSSVKILVRIGARPVSISCANDKPKAS
jgi:hypothetical protein